MAIVTIDGNELEVADGTLIVKAAQDQGISIPTFCYLERLPPLASCRMCLIEIEGQGKLQPACATLVADGMVVRTDTPLVAQTRESMLEMLLANHPLDCPICDKAGECELQDQVVGYGAGESRLRDEKRVFRTEDVLLNPVIVFNANRCIQCQRCVRMCDEVVGAVALGTIEKGMDTEVTGFENSLAGCDHCGNCIEVCPVGALMSAPYRYKARPWDLIETETVCNYCGTGCQLTVGMRDGRLARVRSKYETGMNGETLCVKGRFGFDAIDSEHRIRQPMVRKNGSLVAVSWEDAVAYAEWARKRLPTEAEWERAARYEHDGARFIWGDELAPDGRLMANIWQGDFPHRNTVDDGFTGTAPVKSFPPSPLGLYDLAGNVWEWTNDQFRPDTYQQRITTLPEGGCCSNPTGPETTADPRNPYASDSRVQKGGSFLCHASYCESYRPSAKMAAPPDTGMSHLGFRCVSDSPAPDPIQTED